MDMRISQVMILGLFTAFATYFMNDAFLTGDYLPALFYAFFVWHNLRYSYRVTRFIAAVEAATKKKD